MFAFGLADTGDTVPLFLRAAHGEQVVQVMVVAAFRFPNFPEVADHVAHLGLHAALSVIVADEMNDLPMLIGQRETFLGRLGAGETFAPGIMSRM